MKVVIDEKIPYLCDALQQMGHSVLALPGDAITHEHIADASALFVRTRTLCNAALDDHTWSMGPEDDIEQIIKYVVAVPEVEFDLQEFKKLKEQLEIFKEIGCDTCEHLGVGHDHMPCYKCVDGSEYIWRAAKIEEKYKK